MREQKNPNGLRRYRRNSGLIYPEVDTSPTTIYPDATMNKYETSDGKLISQATINRRYSAMIREMHEGKTYHECMGCGRRAHDNSHIISRRRCKQIHKADLIYDPDNIVSLCRVCHHEFESYKSGRFFKLKNAESMLEFMQKHDPETAAKYELNNERS